jgi:hypothetical protein
MKMGPVMRCTGSAIIQISFQSKRKNASSNRSWVINTYWSQITVPKSPRYNKVKNKTFKALWVRTGLTKKILAANPQIKPIPSNKKLSETKMLAVQEGGLNWIIKAS